jgi:hypothetical protein
MGGACPKRARSAVFPNEATKLFLLNRIVSIRLRAVTRATVVAVVGSAPAFIAVLIELLGMKDEEYSIVPDGNNREPCHVEVSSDLSVALGTHSQYDEAVSFFRQRRSELTVRIAPRRGYLYFP